MVRFGNVKVSNGKWKTRLYLGIFLAIIILFTVAISSFSRVNIEKQEESLESAIQRTITQCYALEGTYPPSLDYMKAHYGLTYDEDLFYVDYQAIGANLRPDVTIIVRE